ncbi:NTP pyrophosphohydrolases including oxidative damage repair enzymes [Vibrio ponticus]|nr:NTP pyrophosphohydrolases including oxidative damage repair enzymes [Vibrio ponticus]
MQVDKIIDKLAWITIQDGKFLAVRSKGKELFYLPGGKREQGESDQQALVREIKEELSVDLDSDTIKYAGTYSAQADGKASGVTVQLTCYFADFSGELAADAEIEELRFIGTEEREVCSLAALVVLDSLVDQQLVK